MVMDQPESAWIEVSAEDLLSEVVPSAGEWLTDGFIMFDPVTSSLVSVDVEEGAGVTFIESTIIGRGFGALRQCFEQFGPEPLQIWA